MNNRVISLIQDIESIISANPESSREIIKMLNALLETKDMEHYLANSEVIVLMLEEWLNKKADIPENSILTVDLNFAKLKEIAADFHSLSEKESTDVAEYLAAVFIRHGDLLQNFLSAKFGTPAKQRTPKNFQHEKLKLWLLMGSMRDSGYTEDFFLEIPKSLTGEAITASISEYYESRGYKLSPINEFGFMVRNAKETFCVVLTRTEILQVTVHASISH